MCGGSVVSRSMGYADILSLCFSWAYYQQRHISVRRTITLHAHLPDGSGIQGLVISSDTACRLDAFSSIAGPYQVGPHILNFSISDSIRYEYSTIKYKIGIYAELFA